MADEPADPGKVKRVAVLVEFENGWTLAAYVQPDPANNLVEVELGETPWAPPTDWHPTRGWIPQPPTYHVHVDRIQEYRVATDMPAMIGATLDAVRNAVNL